ncbi:4a-hydroxytetrahydrobiopterin dehydratase [Salinibacillus xinjiangensis]|uniref:4a-hydroxytetrahydrobiopterin dehydratase n=1 Tax=Salinibacillus xinjiangensis TaxID=1229268 RepID=A0A6G1X8G2_9BACI|nr:4a-hydroxytetrahydrobiopterin dehydratase [Salinibacillus xinjiangensis]MRG87293.1 4a-hydroxytetrahydrobiopterin dehydratase [Salinibacillus xinjiangensis]
MGRLTGEEIEKQLEYLSGWSLEDDRWLTKRYRFTEFLTGIEFVNQIAELSEEMDHHPFISIEYKVVTIKLTSWRAKGITDLDMELIQKYDSIFLQVTE